MTQEMPPYPDYKDSHLRWLGQIPSHWIEKRAKYFLREVDERSTSGEESLMSVSHKTGVTLRKSNVTMFKAASNVGHKICRPGDLAINTLWAWMAAMGVSRQTGLVSPAYGVYRQLDAGNYHPEFLDYLLRTQPYANEYRCRSTGITTSRLRLYPYDFLRIPIVQPPLDEQEIIVTYLNHHDALVRRFIRNRRRLIEVLNEQKQAIIDRAITCGLDPVVRVKPSGIDWLGDVPQHWEVLKLKRVSRIDPPRAESQHLREANELVTFLPMERVSAQGEVDSSQRRAIQEVWQGFTYFRRGDVVVAKITPCFENGKGAWLSELPTEIGFGTTEFIVLRAGDKVRPAFLYQLTMHSAFRHLGVESMTGAAGQQRVSPDFVRDFSAPIPPVEEQDAILTYIQRETAKYGEAIRRETRQIALVQEYRTRLIADVVTGKLDVRHLTPPGEVEDIEGIDAEEALDDELEGAVEGDLAEEALNADD